MKAENAHLPIQLSLTKAMNPETPNPKIPFSKGDWLIDRNNPGQPGQYTGRWHEAGPHIMVELSYPDASRSFRPLSCLEIMPKTADSSIEGRLETGCFGKLRDLQRLITYEKLKGTLHDVIYSMEAAQIDFLHSETNNEKTHRQSSVLHTVGSPIAW